MSSPAETFAKDVQIPATADDVSTCLHELALRLVKVGLPTALHSGLEEILTRVTAIWPEDRRPSEADIMRSAAWAAESVRLTSAPQAAAAAPRVVLRSHADRRRERSTPPPAIVERALPVGGIGAIVAMPGAGKTLVGIELARCVAAGAPFLGRSTMPGRVIYACPDSPASTERRLLAIAEDVADRIDTIAELPSLPGGIDDLRTAIQTASADALDPVRLVVIDTWDSARSHSGDGYAGQDALIEGTMRGLRRMASEMALAVLVIHHATRNDNGRARGSVVFDARADWIALADGDGSTITLRSTKCRDGECGVLGSFQIASEMVHGAPVPVLAPLSSSGPPASRTPPDDREAAVLAVLGRHQGEISKRVLAERSGIPEGSILRTVAMLRGKGLVERDRLMATAAGFRAYEDSLLGVDQTLDQGVL